jgi:exodeoxyribonuclease-3
MRIITVNVNGIRSAARKGFFEWMRRQDADVVCVQETRAHPEQCTPRMLRPKGYYGFLHCGERKGYAGVAVYTRRQPDDVRMGMGVSDFDGEGRYVQVDFGALSVSSLYLPAGSSGPARLAAKFQFMREFYPLLQRLRDGGREHVIGGDWNIAHNEIDLTNWRSNRKNSGFLPKERAWLTSIFDELKYVDVFRRLNPSPGHYTWWSNRGDAWAKNVGWRIDYQIATPGVAAKAKAESIYRRKRFSDHAPLTIDYDYDL